MIPFEHFLIAIGIITIILVIGKLYLRWESRCATRTKFDKKNKGDKIDV